MTAVLAEHDQLIELLDNHWLSLTVVDPTQDHRAFHYDGELTWTRISEQPKVSPDLSATASVADD